MLEQPNPRLQNVTPTIEEQGDPELKAECAVEKLDEPIIYNPKSGVTYTINFRWNDKRYQTEILLKDGPYNEFSEINLKYGLLFHREKGLVGHLTRSLFASYEDYKILLQSEPPTLFMMDQGNILIPRKLTISLTTEGPKVKVETNSDSVHASSGFWEKDESLIDRIGADSQYSHDIPKDVRNYICQVKYKPSKEDLDKLFNEFVNYHGTGGIKKQKEDTYDECYLRAAFVTNKLAELGIYALKIWKVWSYDEFKEFLERNPDAYADYDPGTNILDKLREHVLKILIKWRNPNAYFLKDWNYHMAAMIEDSNQHFWIWDPWVRDETRLLSLEEWLKNEKRLAPSKFSISSRHCIRRYIDHNSSSDKVSLDMEVFGTERHPYFLEYLKAYFEKYDKYLKELYFPKMVSQERQLASTSKWLGGGTLAGAITGGIILLLLAFVFPAAIPSIKLIYPIFVAIGIVLGGGVIGSAIAYYIGEKGAESIIDPAGPNIDEVDKVKQLMVKVSSDAGASVDNDFSAAAESATRHSVDAGLEGTGAWDGRIFDRRNVLTMFGGNVPKQQRTGSTYEVAEDKSDDELCLNNV